MSSRNIKIIISVIILLIVVVIIAFALQKGSQPSNVGESAVVQSPEDFKQSLINDDMSDPAVSQDDIENDEHPALDVSDAEAEADANSDAIIEDPEAEKL